MATSGRGYPTAYPYLGKVQSSFSMHFDILLLTFIDILLTKTKYHQTPRRNVLCMPKSKNFLCIVRLLCCILYGYCLHVLLSLYNEYNAYCILKNKYNAYCKLKNKYNIYLYSRCMEYVSELLKAAECR